MPVILFISSHTSDRRDPSVPGENLFSRLIQLLLRQRRRHIPRPGEWYITPEGKVLRVSIVSTESQKVVCERPGCAGHVTMPLTAFVSGNGMKHAGGQA